MGTNAAKVTPLPQKRFTRYLDRKINESAKSQREIADEIGYDRPNIITMFKQGSCRVPPEKLPALADALEIDRAELTRLWMQDHEPALLAVIDENMGMALSRTERSWVVNLRKLFKESEDGLPVWDEMVEQQLKPLVK